MARPALLGVVVAALLPLSACGPGVPEAAPPPPDANLCSGWTPSSSVCRDDNQCEAFGGCTQEWCDPATGEVEVLVCEAPLVPEARIEGFWTITSFLLAEDPCPAITRIDDLRLVMAQVVDGPTGSSCDVLDVAGHLLDVGEVERRTGSAHVRFTLHPTWTDADGAEVPVVVDYELDVNRPGRIEGRATATATAGDATYVYYFEVIGQRG